MATEKQRQAAKKNIKKAQSKWRSMPSGQRSHSQPEGRERKKPGSTGEGNYYHVEVRRRSEFTTFRTQDVGDPGHIQRVAGKRPSGSWATVKWLIGKEDAHVQDGRLIPDTKDAREVIDQLGSEPVHLSGDRFKASPGRDIPEDEKPTPAQKQARSTNIKKAQAARQNKS